MKIVLCIWFALVFTEAGAQTLDSIQVDSFINAINPPSHRQQLSNPPGGQLIVHTVDAHERPKLEAYVGDSAVSFEFYTYDGVGNITEQIFGSCYLRQNHHWYLICPPKEKIRWQKDIKKMRGR